MANEIEYSRLVLKRSTVPGVVPTIPESEVIDNEWLETDLLIGEMFVNTEDDKAWIRTGNGIFEFTVPGSTSVNWFTTGARLVGDILYFDRTDTSDAYSVDLSSIQGAPGPKGDRGEPGEPGVAGADGKDGVDGAPGVNGAPGADGKDGVDGAPGDKGDKGDKGEPGIPGADGKDGEQGIPGPKGDKGDSGDSGPILIINGNAVTGLAVHVDIPEGITSVGGLREEKITSLSLPESLITIESGAFQFNKLTSIVIPDSVTTIESSAFTLNQLTSVSFGTGLTSIGEGAFRNNQLTSVDVPIGCTVDPNAFDSGVTINYV